MAPANFKSYEAQARLLRAIVAAHPEVKWNYKDIAKFFGESTADGIQFQFRGIKKDAESLKQTANNGGNPATALSLPASGTSSVASTPRKPRTPSTKVRASGGGRSTTAKKTKQLKPVSMSEEDEDDEEVDYNELEDTPSKTRVRDRILDGRVSKNVHTPNPRRSATPSRAATIVAAANIAQAAAVDLTTSDSEVNTPDNVMGYELPAPVETKPAAMMQQQQQQPFFDQSAVQQQPAVQPAASSMYSDPSSLSQPLSADLWSTPVEDPLNFSFADGSENGNGGYYSASYMDNNSGEI
ncbi:hypothetical protein EsH8_III_000666 [Colletotrichum jinshuiense]